MIKKYDEIEIYKRDYLLQVWYQSKNKNFDNSFENLNDVDFKVLFEIDFYFIKT